MNIIKKKIPWWLKIPFKIVLSRLPVNYNNWKFVSLFQHGYMDDPQYSYNVFDQHFKAVNVNSGFRCLELGPGDSLATAIIAKFFGASESVLLDAGYFASKNEEIYKKLYDHLIKETGSKEVINTNNIEDLLKSCNSGYMTDGLNSFEKLPDNYFDMIFSQAVLEHIRISEFHKTLCEMYRVLKTGCYTSHVIDFQDHLDNSLNSLRFSSKLWESNLFSKSGFYTNRLRKSEVLNEFIKVGFKIRSVSCSKWDKIPLDVKKLYGKYKNYSEDDLLTKGMTIVLQK